MKIVYEHGTRVGRSKFLPLKDNMRYDVYDTDDYSLKSITVDEILDNYIRNNSYFYNVSCDKHENLYIKVIRENFRIDRDTIEYDTVKIKTVFCDDNRATIVRVQGGICYAISDWRVPVIINNSWLYFSETYYERSCIDPVIMKEIGIYSGEEFDRLDVCIKRKFLLSGKSCKLYEFLTNSKSWGDKPEKHSRYECRYAKGLRENEPIAIHLRTGEVLFNSRESWYRLYSKDEDTIDATLLLGSDSLYFDACGYYTSRATQTFTGWDSKTWEVYENKRDKVIEHFGGLKRFYLREVKSSIGCATIRELSYGQIFVSTTDVGTFCKIGGSGFGLLQIKGSLFVFEDYDTFVNVPYIIQKNFIAITSKYEDDLQLCRCSLSLDTILQELKSGSTVDTVSELISSHLTGINQYVVCKDMEE